jgi:hypothetical protein
MADPHSLLNREKFPVLREFRRTPRAFAAIRCISGRESRDINRLALIFVAPGAAARERAAKGGGQTLFNLQAKRA